MDNRKKDNQEKNGYTNSAANCYRIQGKYGCKDQESIQLSTTPDPEYQ